MPQTDIPLIIAVAPNGARRTKQDHPKLPLSAAELAETAASCLAAGVSMIHLHIRDADGQHSLDPGAYREATAAIRRAVGQRIVVQITTEAVGRYRPAEQIASVRAVRPEAASVALRELAPDAAHERAAADFFAWAQREKVALQFILYDAADVARLIELQRRGIVPQAQPNVLFVLGRYAAGQQSDPADLLPFLQAAGHAELGSWAVCAFGRREAACALTAAALGGHARVGFENNMLLADGAVAADNAALVTQLARAVPLTGRPLADADRVREIMAA